MTWRKHLVGVNPTVGDRGLTDACQWWHSSPNFVTHLMHAGRLTKCHRRNARVLPLPLSYDKRSGNMGDMAIGIAEAAERLGVSRQRVLQMIADQRLPAERVGQSWSISEADLARHRVPVGRPLSTDMARGFLDLAAGKRPELSSRDISRLRGNMIRLVREVRSDGDPASLLRSWLPRRAVRLEMSVAEADLSEALADDRLVISGISDKRAGMSSDRVGEGYVDEQVADDFFDDHFVVEAQERANLIIHVAVVVPPISPVVIAADLSDYRAGREDRQARVVLENWIESGDYDENLLFGRRRP